MPRGFRFSAFVLASFLATLLLAGGSARAEPAGTNACDSTNLLAGRAPVETDNVTGPTAHVTDGAIGHEGAPWDAPEAVTFTGAGSLIYDLGAAHGVSAAYIQADGNDTYRLDGSLDGTPGSYRPLGEFENVRRLGHGLRSRTLHFAPANVRFLRVSEGSGDGAFSIAELAAYCSTPSPFPPVFRVEGPSAGPLPVRDDASAGPTIPLEEDTNGPARLPLLLAAVVLLVFGAATSLRRANATRPKRTEEQRALERERARAAATENLLRLMFLGSGCAALIYEVIWFHLMRLVIGASALSVGIVLASFMGGMFLGSLLFPRFVPAARHPLRVYGLLELGVGACGVLMPLVLPAVRSVYVGLVGYGALGIALRAVIATVLLLPPTALMGATLPAIARRYPAGRRGMSSLAWLYSTNTAGAVLGSLLAAFYLLALFDVWVATLTAAALNFVVGGLGLRLSRTTPHALAVRSRAGATGARKQRARAERSGAGIDARAIYTVAGLSGLTALGAQVLWTRLLTLLLGATVFAFAIILGVFLAGLGLGSALAAYLLRRGQRAARALAWSQLLLVPALFVSGFVLARYLPFASPPAITPVSALHGLHVIRAAVVILPPAVLWGASFPFALAAAASSDADTGRSSAYVYAANTVGAIAGSLGVSFWMIPSYGSGVAGRLLAGTAGVSAAVAFHALARAAARAGRAPKGVALEPTWALGLGALAAALVPSLSPVFLAHGRYIWWVDTHDRFPYVSEGAASTVAVHQGQDGYKNFHVAGRVEATNNPSDLRTERLIGHLSGLPHPHPQSVLVVGMGGGISAGALSLYPEVKRIVICEIEPRVVGATRQFADENYHVLDNPKVEVVFDDARHFLATTREKFDIITSDPIHPWVRGNSILFSREYYEIVRNRLNPGGLATQWVPLYETSELAIKIQMQTFMAAFPNGTVWNTQTSGKGYDVVLVGGEAPLRLDVASIQRRIDENPRLKQSLADVKINDAVDLLATYGASGADMKAWLANTPVNRDFSLKLEYISGLALNTGGADTIYAHMVEGRTYPAFIAGDGVDRELRRRVMAGGG